MVNAGDDAERMMSAVFDDNRLPSGNDAVDYLVELAQNKANADAAPNAGIPSNTGDVYRVSGISVALPVPNVDDASHLKSLLEPSRGDGSSLLPPPPPPPPAAFMSTTSYTDSFGSPNALSRSRSKSVRRAHARSANRTRS